MATSTQPVTIHLSIETSDGQAERLRIDEAGPVVIGRDQSCHVVLPSPDVSRRHVALRVDGERIRLTDKSANGTFVGEHEKRIQGSTIDIAPGVPFRVGPYRLCVIDPADVSGRTRRGTQPLEGPLGGPGAVPDAPTVPDPAESADAPPRRPTMRSPAPGAQPVVVPDGPASSTPPPPPSGPSPEVAIPAAVQGSAAGAMISAHRLSRASKSSKYGESGTGQVGVEVRRRIHRMLLDHLDLASLDRKKMDDRIMRPKVREALTRICRQIARDLPEGTDIARLIDEMTDEALGLGPLEILLADDGVSEIMVVDPITIFIERDGRIEHTDLRFTDDDAVRSVIERIVTPLGRRIDESNPLVDARLKDGSRVNAIIPPLALRGPCITIRKFARNPLTIDDLIGFGAMTDRMAQFLVRSVVTKKNVVISGGTGSGKTTLLNVLSAAVPEDERIVTIEDAAELRLSQPHVVSLEARPPNMEGRGEITIRQLVRNALRMRPDRIVVGECRGGEALDMLQAMNTGHEGSMTTTHANSPREAIGRLETLALMSGLDLPSRAVREQIAASVHLVVQQARFSDGSRRVTAISEVLGVDDEGEIEHQDIFRFHRLGTGTDGRIRGEFRATGYLPSFLDDFITHGLVGNGDYL